MKKKGRRKKLLLRKKLSAVSDESEEQAVFYSGEKISVPGSWSRSRGRVRPTAKFFNNAPDKLKSLLIYFSAQLFFGLRGDKIGMNSAAAIVK